jgi:predicted GNAT family N-acyltransferase
VAIDIYIENLGKEPFLRIDVAASPTKPHCTPKGIYCRRAGSRNRPLHPSELLRIFLESESRAFAERFELAANRITEGLAELEENLDNSIDAMADKLGWAEHKLGDTESTLDSVLAYAQRINTETNDLTTRLRTIFRQDQRQDPINARERKKLLDEIIDQLHKDKTILKAIKAGKSLTISAQGMAAEELTQDDLGSIFREAVKIVTDHLERNKYYIAVKAPAKCDEDELKELANLIAEGGEVADGVDQRLKTADTLGLVRYEKGIVGTAAVKKPNANYRKDVFEKAKASVAPADFSRELGWIFLKEEHRSKGQIQPLIETVLKAAGTCGIFATTRISNEKMQHILAHQGFVRHGEAYASIQNPGDKIMLFIRSGSKVAPKSEASA